MNTKNKHHLDPRLIQIHKQPAHFEGISFQSKEAYETNDTSSLISLNGEWSFVYYSRYLDTLHVAATPDMYALSDLTDFKKINVPGVWELQGYGKPYYLANSYPPQIDVRKNHIPGISETDNPTGLYLRDFDVPDTFNGQRVFVRFNGVKGMLEVAINGKFVGLSKGSMTPHEFEITEFIHPGTNRIGALVVKYSDASYLEDQDMWFMAGLLRDVELFCEPTEFIRDAFATCVFDHDYRDATLKLKLEIEAMNFDDLSIRVSLRKEKAIRLFEGKIGGSNIEIEKLIEAPLQWTAETPELYEIKIELFRKTSLIQIKKFDYGFRQVEIRDSMLLLNGKPIKFRGVNRHDFNTSKGWSMNIEDRENDLRILKAHNINAIRCSHYPNDRSFYQLCDKHGFYVIDEADLETHGVRDFLPKDDLRWRDAMIDRGIRMVRRDRNHPCILLWSLGNESGSGSNFQWMKQAMKAEDASRPFHYEGDRDLSVSDVKSMMYPSPKRVESYGKKEDILARSPLDLIRKGLTAQFYHHRKDYESMPVMVCEYAHCMGNSLGNLREYMDVFEAYPNLIGGFIWDFADQAIKQVEKDGRIRWLYGGDFGEEKSDGPFCANGIVAADRTLHPAIAEVKKVYAPIAITQIDLQHVSIQNKNAFIDTSTYRFEGYLQIDGVKTETFEFSVDPILPGKSATIKLPIQLDPTLDNDVLLEIDVVSNTASFGVEIGDEITFFQFEISRKEIKISDQQQACPAYEETDANITIHTLSSKFILSKSTGFIEHISTNDENLLISPLMPNFSRADTDNDRMLEMWVPAIKRFNLNKRWVDAFADRKLTDMIMDQNVNFLRIVTKFNMPNTRRLEITYDFYDNGSVAITLTILPTHEIPRIGMTFATSPDFQQVTFYGKGPQENYRDRNSGCKMKVHEGTIWDFTHDYMRPQENGNHTEVRSLSVASQTSRFEIRASGKQSLNVSVWPYTQAQLHEATHIHRLPKHRLTTINVDYGQRGVGGETPMRGEVLPQYILRKGKTYSYTFILIIH